MTLQSVFLAILLAVASAGDWNVVNLDNHTLPMLVGKDLPAFVRFGKEYDYGESADAFKKVAEVAAGNKIIIGSVGISTYGEKLNSDLAEKYGYKPKGKDLEFDDFEKLGFPKFRFFPARGGKDIEYTGAVKTDDMVNFLKTEAKIYFGLQGQLLEFDKLAAEFTRVSDKKAVLAKAKAAEADEKDKEAATYYLKAMEKSIEKDGWASKEHARLTKMMGGSQVTKDQKGQMQLKLNRLSAFVSPHEDL